MKKRGRPPIREDVEHMILTRIQEYLEDSSKEKKFKKVFISELRDELEKTQWKPPIKGPLPTIGTLVKRFDKYREIFENPDPEDEPWSIATLDRYPIPPEALPVILKEYRRHKSQPNSENFPPTLIKEVHVLQREGENPSPHDAERLVPVNIELELPDIIADSVFTIRQAKWVARLSKTECADNLPYFIARAEQLYEILGQNTDLELFDKILAGLPGTAENWQIPMAATFSIAGSLKNDPTKKNENNRKGKNNERKEIKFAINDRPDTER